MTISVMNRLSCALVICFLSISGIFAQDTITIQTFDWTSDTRNDVFEFPNDPNQTFSKILMTYNMRCHDNAVGNGNVGCREWDYSCNTFITDSSRTDSLLRFHPDHLISGYAVGETFEYTSQPIYSYVQYDRIKTTIDTVYQADTLKTLSEDSDVRILYEDQAAFQFILTPEELQAAGVQAGEIVALEMPFELGDFVSMSFRVRLTNTDKTELTPDAPIKDGWEEVYFDRLEINFPGMGVLPFNTPFTWDGTSSLGVELIFNDKMTPTQERIFGEDGAGKAILVDQEDHIFALNGAQYFKPDPRDFREVSEEITIMVWLMGNPDELPFNTYFLEGVDADGNRQVNIHLPWGNSEVYWDCGNDGSGYDRINKLADVSDFSGQWNHWAFTKNATTGNMSIYLNGELWHTGTGKVKPMDIQELIIGKGIGAEDGWSGWVNELSLWSKALDQSEIQLAMMSPVDANHPQYDDLRLYFNFEEARGDRVTNIQNNQDYMITGSPHWRKLRAEDLYFNYRGIDARPAIGLIQGDIETSTEINPYIDSAMIPPNWVRPFHIENRADVVEDAPMFLWKAGDYNVVNNHGDVIRTLTYTAEGEITIGELEYFNFRPAKFEILSLVTPYGNGLSLGKDGKTFTFDVTDFAPILQGKKRMSVELGGEWQEELDVQFHFIKGTPPREVLDIQNLWAFQRGGYGPIQEDRVLEPRTVNLHPDAEKYKIRSSITGHGQNGEFQPRQHYINVDGGQQEFIFSVWKECSTIPIYPQGGTWLFDRAGWCPGDPTLLFEHDLSEYVSPGQSVEIDYGVNGAFMDQANYLVSNQLVSYGPFNRQVDIGLEHIVRPSQNVEWERENPSCNTPTVIIKNYGSDPITNVQFSYGVIGGIAETYTWQGYLETNETGTVEFPVLDEKFWAITNGDGGVFEVEITEVNGEATDDEKANNIMRSPFELPALLPSAIQLEILTNSRGSETSFQLKNRAGEILYEGSNFQPTTKYTYELDLAPGCYTLEVNDSGDDGLDYWYYDAIGQGRGRGYVSFNRNFNGRWIGVKGFDSEFGRYIHYDFGIGSLTDNNDPKILQQLAVYPNPTSGEVKMDFYSESNGHLELEVTDALGRNLLTKSMKVNAGGSLYETIDLSDQKNGIYFLRFTQDNKTTTKSIVLNK